MPSKVATLDDIRRAALRGQSRDRAWLVGFTVGWPLLLLACLWAASGPGTNDAAMGVLWIGSVVTLFVIPMAAQRAYRCPRRLRVACTAGILVAIVALVGWTVTGGLAATKLRLDQGSWQQTLNALGDGRTILGCEVPHPPVTVAAFGQIDQVCGTSPPTGLPRAVVFMTQASGPSLIYYPHAGSPPASDQCVRHIGGWWWDAIPVGTSGGCMLGFRLEGGP
ncbi:MAG: hypothetical protein WBG41_13440 [Acidimicrobiales bacterium]